MGTRPRSSIAVLLGVLLILAVAPAVGRAQGQARISVRQFGWQADGSLSSASWNPVSVRVSGPPTSDEIARVQVVLRVSNASGGARGGLYTLGAYGQDVALPAGVEKDQRIW